VRNGDTLWDIARAHDVSVKQLLAANGMKRPKIRPGQRLVLPKGAPSTVAAHEPSLGQ
jgi:LysM repeat protein